MEQLKQSLALWGKQIEQFQLPTWEELPELDLYMDQVITLVDRYLSPVIEAEKHPLLTSSMVNNYVKLDLIPAPIKKKYNKTHVAFLIAITLLKQVLSIAEVKEGILFQGKTIGIREAYELFCNEQESAIRFVSRQAQGKQSDEPINVSVPVEQMAVRSATMAFAMRLLAEKMIALESVYMNKTKEEN